MANDEEPVDFGGPEANTNLRYRRYINPDGSEGGLVGINSHISKTAYIGPNVVVDNYAHIGDRARILDQSRVHSSSVVEEDAVVRDHSSIGAPGIGIVRGNAVVSGYSRVNGGCIVEGDARLKDMDVGSNLVISGGEWNGINTPPWGGSRLFFSLDDDGTISNLRLWTGKEEPLENAETLLKHVTTDPDRGPPAKGTRGR